MALFCIFKNWKFSTFDELFSTFELVVAFIELIPYIMLKFGILICVFFVLFGNGYSAQVQDLNFGSILGGCPKVSGSSSSVLENFEGRWYTNSIISKFSPLKYLRCQSSMYDFKSQEASTVFTELTTPYLPISLRVEGDVQRIESGEYDINYKTNVLGNIPQKIVVLQDFDDAALVWTCSDFKFFHLDNIQILTKTNDPSSSSNAEDAISSARQALRRIYGISPSSFVEIDQSC